MRQFAEQQRDQLKIRRLEWQNPAVVLDFYAARAILEEGLEAFWPEVSTTDLMRRQIGGTNALVDLAARCQQVAEDLNMVDKPPANEVEYNQNLVKFTRDLLNHIMRNASTVPAAQRGKSQLSFTFDESWMHETLEKLDEHVFPPTCP